MNDKKELIENDAQNIVLKREQKNKIYIIVISILVLIILGLILFIIFCKNKDNEDKNKINKEENNSYLALYTDNAGFYCYEVKDECKNEIAKFSVTDKNAKVYDYTIFDDNGTDGVVLYFDKNLKYYDISTKISVDVALDVDKEVFSYNVVVNKEKEVVGVTYTGKEISGFYNIKQDKKMYEGQYDTIYSYKNVGDYIHATKEKEYGPNPDDIELNKDEFILSVSEEKVILTSGGVCNSLNVFENDGTYIFADYSGCSGSKGIDVHTLSGKTFSGDFNTFGSYIDAYKLIEIGDGRIYYADNTTPTPSYWIYDFNGNLIINRKLPGKGEIIAIFEDYYVYEMQGKVYVSDIDNSFTEYVMDLNQFVDLGIISMMNTSRYDGRDGISFSDDGSFELFFDFNTKKVKQVKGEMIEELSLDDKNVKELYGYFSDVSIRHSTDFGDIKPGFYDLSNIKKEELNYIAYLSLNQNDFDIVNCSNYAKYSNKEELRYCGNSEGDGDAEKTNSLKGSMLKKQVEKIFGENSYKAINFYDCPSTYYYVANEDIYINQGRPMGGNFSTASFKLSKAYKSGDDLVMEVLYDTDAHSDEEIDKYDFIYIYTFELKNDSYIFKSLDKKFVS